MDIDRNRRYARLMSIAKKPDDSLRAWLWLMAMNFDTYIYCQRYMKQQNLTTADLQLHNESEIA